MSKHFCCCIPVRFGVFVLSLLTLLGSIASAGGAWFVIGWGSQNGIDLDGTLRIVFIVTGVLYSLFALISLAGFIGAIIRNKALVRTYSIFLWFQLAASLALSIYFIVALNNGTLRQRLIDQCVQNSTRLQSSIEDAASRIPNTSIRTGSKSELKEACESIWNGGRIGFIVAFVLSFLINLYCCIVVHRYGTQLAEEATAKNVAAYTSSHQMAPSHYSQDKSGQSAYYPHTPLSNVDPSQGGYVYPYAQPQHSHGGGH